MRKLLDHRRGGQGHPAITARFRDGHLPARPSELSVRQGDPLAEGRDIQTIVLRAILHACLFLHRCHRTATRSIGARASATCGRQTMIQPPEGTARSSLRPYAYFVSFYRRKKCYSRTINSKESLLCSPISHIVTGRVLRASPMGLASQGTGCALSVARRGSPRSSGKPTAAYACRVG